MPARRPVARDSSRGSADHVRLSRPETRWFDSADFVDVRPEGG